MGPSGYTYIFMINPVDVAGTLKSWCIYTGAYSGGGDGKLKIFRSSGADFVFVGESTLKTLTSDLNNLPNDINISVQAGDLIGFYAPSVTGSGIGLVYDPSLRASLYFKSGDITTTSAKSSWSYLSNQEVRKIRAYAGDIFVNSSTGDDAKDGLTVANAKKTFGSAYSALPATGAIRILNSGADFSAETVTRDKSYSMDGYGSNIYWYGPKSS